MSLRQSPHTWFRRFVEVIFVIIYKKDHTLFIKQSNSRGATTLFIYVDNIMIKNNKK